jgi:AcrR family transcriptional regulator
VGDSQDYGISARDPLADTLFRSTALAPAIASAAPVRVTGTRTRAGNSMNRTRAALLDGARQAVATSGTKLSMSQVATCAGVAKATLYNHFRTREAVLAALVDYEVARLVDSLNGLELPRALEQAAAGVANHPVLRALARVEPATLARLGRVDIYADGWRQALDAVRTHLAAAGVGGERVVLRWLASFVLAPANAHAIADDVGVLLAGLPPSRPDAEALTA